jgi:predicted P-loop ATPase
LATRDEWFSDQSILGVDDRQQQELLSGKIIYEIAELHGLKTTQIEKIKSFASRQYDRARPAFGKGVEERGRTVAIFATTNEDAYLLEGTGHRPIWPVLTTKIDLDALARDVPQLWAEAVDRRANGERPELPKELWAEARAQQDERTGCAAAEKMGRIGPQQ